MVSVAPWRGQLQPLGGEVDADDSLGALQAGAGDGAEADHAGANTTQVLPAAGGGVDRRAEPVERPQANSRRARTAPRG